MLSTVCDAAIFFSLHMLGCHCGCGCMIQAFRERLVSKHNTYFKNGNKD